MTISISMINTGDLLFIRGRSAFSWLIELTGSYSHVACLLKIKIDLHPEEIWCVFEAVVGVGVRLVPLEKYVEECLKSKTLVDHYAIRTDIPFDRVKFVNALLATWGEKYSKSSQLLFTFLTPLRYLRKKLNLKPVDNMRPFCSWNIARCAIEAGYQPDENLPLYPEDMTPTDVSHFSAWERIGPLKNLLPKE